MDITEVRIKLMEDGCQFGNERLHAFCSVTLDNEFVVRDLKIIEGTKGFFVAMPSRKLTDRCPGCRCKNHLKARFCTNCGRKLDEDRAPREPDGRTKLHADIAHPINQECRDKMQRVIMKAYEEEKERAKLPGYRSRYDDLDGDFEPEENGYAEVVGRVDAPSNGSGRAMHRPHRHNMPPHGQAAPSYARDRHYRG